MLYIASRLVNARPGVCRPSPRPAGLTVPSIIRNPSARAVKCPPMLRKLFTFAAAVSAVLCVAVGVFWVRSDSVYDRLSFGRRGGRYVLAVSAARNAWVAVAGDWDADEPLPVGSDPKWGPNTYVARMAWTVGAMRTWTMPGVEIESGTGWLGPPSRRVVITAYYPPHRLTDVRVWWGW